MEKVELHVLFTILLFSFACISSPAFSADH